MYVDSRIEEAGGGVEDTLLQTVALGVSFLLFFFNWVQSFLKASNRR